MTDSTDAGDGVTHRMIGGVVWWAAVLFTLTGLAVAWLVVVGVDPQEEFSPAIIVIAYSPTVAALIVVALLTGARGTRALLRPVLRWRVGAGWYALALVAPPVMVLVANLLHVAFGGQLPDGWLPSMAGFGALIGPLIGPLIAGTLGEELGWRGFAQPRLQATCRALTASIVIGVLWATWHQWALLAPGAAAEPLDVLASYLRLVATAVLYGWLYNTTRSLLLVMVAHAGHNLAVGLIPTPDDPHGGWHLILAIVYVAAAVVVIRLTNTQTLTRRSTQVGPGVR